MSLSIAERPAPPGYQEQEYIRLEQIGDMVCQVDLRRSAVVMDYELFCKSVNNELRQISSLQTDIDRHFDLVVVNRLRTYFSRDFPDQGFPATLIFETDTSPYTPWLGGFHCLRDNYIAISGLSAGLCDPAAAPELRFERPDQTPLTPDYPDDSRQWWLRNGRLLV